jgi:hypothetical protein
MPKSRGRRRPNTPPSSRVPPLSPAAPATMQIPLGYDPNGPMEQRSVIGLKDGWSEYTLDDGTVIRAKAALIDVKTAVGQFNPLTGEPIYVLQLTIVNSAIVPENLKKKQAKPK